MKKILIIILLFSITQIFSQEYYIELNNGYKTTTSKLRYLNNNKIVVFQDVNGVHKEKKNNIKVIKPTKLPKDKFVYNQLGLTPYVVVEFDSIPREKLYKLIKNWIKETYKNPDKVIKAEIDHKKIRIEGYSDTDISMTALGKKIYSPYTYSISISVKDNKYKFEPISLEGVGSYYSIPLTDGSGYFNKIGLPKSNFRDFVVEVGNLFENLNNRLKNYINKHKNENENTDDDW